MYDFEALFAKLDEFKKEVVDSSSNGKKGVKAAGLRARNLSVEIGKEFKEFRKQSISLNV